MLDKTSTADIGGAGRAQQAPRRGLNLKYAAGIVAVHLVALLAFVPWFFSWTGVVLALLGLYVFGTLGINIGYHRLLTHRGLSCPRWLEHALACLGVCCVQDSPLVWVAQHRRHHQYADKACDPHSPLASFLWAHIGWLMVASNDSQPSDIVQRYAPDLQRDQFYAWLAAADKWALIAFGSWAVFYAAGFAAIVADGGSTAEANQFGWSLLIWGAAMRTVLVWHITWSVNSVTHLWGYRSFATPDNSRNNLWVSIVSNGEGWHNNHHADPQAAQHGVGWREPDMAWLTITVLRHLGLVHEVVLSRRGLTLRRREFGA